MPTVPTRGETFSRLIEYLRQAQDQAAIMSHLHNTEDSPKDKLLARMWLDVEELLKRTVHNVTKLAQGKLQ